MSESDISYYERRLAEELAASDAAGARGVKEIHRKRAELYRQRIVTLAAAPCR